MEGLPAGLHRYNTGGSSGEPLVFYFDRRRQAYDKAARALTHRWWGIDVGDKELYLWGSPLEIGKQDRIKDLRDRLTNELLISAFEISEAKVPGIVEQFRRFKPKGRKWGTYIILLHSKVFLPQRRRWDRA